MTTVAAGPSESLVPVAAATAATALLLTLIGTYVDTPFRSSGSGRWSIATGGRGNGMTELLALVLFALVGTALVFGLIVRPALRSEPGRTGVVALVVAIVAVVSILVFWTGLPAVFAIAAAVLARNARARLGHFPVPVLVALVLAVLAILGAVWIAFTG
jgi:hypothetical protein